MIVANGIGVNHRGMRFQIKDLARRYRVVTWTCRGMSPDGPAPPDADYSVAAHARDLAAVLAAEGVERAAGVGWSMGVQVLLELLRLDTCKLEAMAAISGVHANPFRSFLGLPGVGRLMLSATRIPVALPGVADLLMRSVTRLPGLQLAMKAVGWVSPTADPDTLRCQTDAVAGTNKRAYFKTLLELGLHDATDLLPRISFPLLVVAGERDLFTPPAVARELHEAVAGSRLRILDGASHYCVLEQPEALNRELEEFLGEVYPPSP